MSGELAYNKAYAFNAICPYYTMFPLEYPMAILKKHRAETAAVLDPFCGRGTTIYAARYLGLESAGIDSSPIAAAIARAKLASAKAADVITLAERLVSKEPKNLPTAKFFQHAFSQRTLKQVCSLREGLLEQPLNDVSAILLAACLGCLHGPRSKGAEASYFSNQMPRTFASKPDYSVRYWLQRGMEAPEVDVISVLRRKLVRIADLSSDSPSNVGQVRCGDSRKLASYKGLKKVSLTITSPPYYGMKTYVQDQWLRMWFIGGDEEINYRNDAQLSHNGHETFIADLAKVWSHVGARSTEEAHLYVRFGTLQSAKSDAKELMRESLREAGGWNLISTRAAHTAHAGKRQADQMGMTTDASEEFDFHAIRA